MRSTLPTQVVFASAGRSTWILGVVLVLVSGLIPIRSSFGQSTAYVVTDLTSEDATQVPSKLNNLGDIVGHKAEHGEGAPRATLWRHSRSNGKRLGAFAGGDYSSANDINDGGEIAGISNTGTGLVPFLWNERSGLRRLSLLPGDSCGQAVAINKHGHVVCYSSGAYGTRALLWTRKTGNRALGVLSGGNYSRGRDLNDSDEVVGVSGSAAGERAILWTQSGGVRDLGTLPGDWSSQAMAINNAGDVVGYSKGPTGTRAFLWTKGGGMEELGVLPGGNSSRALDINDSGLVVGISASAAGDRAFIWKKQTGILDLNDAGATALGFVLVEAHAINRRGEILAMGKMMHGTMAPEDEPCAPAPPLSFLLTPVASP